MNSVIRKRVNEMIGDKLRELRESRELTQEELAAALNTDSHYISSLENGKRGIGPDMLRSYCNYFQLSEQDMRSYLPNKKGGKYPPIAQMIIDEIMVMELPDQTRLLALLQEAKQRRLQGNKDGE